MQRDLDILLAHRDTLFPGPHLDNPWVRLFLSHVSLEHGVQLEFSRKVSLGKVRATRPSMGFVTQVPGHLGECLRRLDHYGPAFDPSPVRAAFEATGIDTADMMIHGLELGDSIEETRVKLHVRFAPGRRSREAVLSHPDTHPGVNGLIDHARLTLGFDLFTGRRTRLRNYLSFERPAGLQHLFESRFGPALANAMAQASNIWLAWKDEGPEPFIYFIDPDAARFATLLGVSGIDAGLTRHQGQAAYIFGAPLHELQRGAVDHYNLYFMLRDRPSPPATSATSGVETPRESS